MPGHTVCIEAARFRTGAPEVVFATVFTPTCAAVWQMSRENWKPPIDAIPGKQEALSLIRGKEKTD